MQLSVLSERRTFNQLNQELLELKKAGKEKSAEYSDLEDLITALKAKGVTSVKLAGTLMADGDGNSIISSTEKQL